MDYFDVEENKQKEALEEKKYQELYAKQAKISKIILLACFLPMGILLLVLELP